jgi:glycosyltransferase involved in cell wall biosynthesis
MLIDHGDGQMQTISPSEESYVLTAQLWYIAERHGISHKELITSDRVFRWATTVLRGCDVIHARLTLFDLATACVERELGIPLVVEANAPLVEETLQFYPDVFLHHPEKLARIAINRSLNSAASVGTVVIYVGSLQPWHGVDMLIRAFALLSSGCSNAKLLIVGDGVERSRLEQLTEKLNLKTRKRFVGEVAHSRVKEFLVLADVAVAPYPQLPMVFYFSPLKVFEYMAAGKAIVASRVGQIADILTGGYDGILTGPGDMEALAAAIDRLILDIDLRHKLGNYAREKIERKTHVGQLHRSTYRYLRASTSAKSR